MKNWNHATTWNSNQMKAWDGSKFHFFRKKSFYIDLPTDISPTRQETLLFLIAKGYEVYDFRFTGLSHDNGTTRHTLEAFIRR